MTVIATHLAVAGLLLTAAVCDLRAYRIPNVISLALLAIFAATVMLGLQDTVLPHLISFAIAGLIGGALYAFHIWGGGDTKLAAAFAVFLMPGDLGRFFFISSVAGGVLAVAFLIDRRVANGPNVNSGHIPYGIALATGGLDWCLLS